METVKASIVQDQEKCFIRIESEDGEIIIPMTEDRPNEVKKAFNRIISRIRTIGEFQIELETVGEDLFVQVASEYISQLNREILEVHGAMRHAGLCRIVD